MISKKIPIMLVAILTANLLTTTGAFAADKVTKTAVNDVSGAEDFQDLNVVVDAKKVETKNNKKVVRKKVKPANAEVASTTESCAFNYPDSESYGAQVVSIRRQLKVNPGETFRVKVFMKNKSNMPWFSNQSTCHGLKMSLGTDKERDHEGLFYTPGLGGWESSSRIAMDQLRVDPDQIASFTFIAQAGKRADVYKEYFTPAVKDGEWIDSGTFYLDTIVGETGENAGELRKKIAFAVNSGSVTSLDLNAQRTIKVDLSEQKIAAYLGDNQVREFRVSTGKPSTPTPTGNYDIFLKQEVRVGNEPPHYIMPKYMMFRPEGYGFHALPSLARGGGDAFWTEARDHIGIPVSHGCIRLLPEDAAWLFDFSVIGTKVAINY